MKTIKRTVSYIQKCICGYFKSRIRSMYGDVMKHQYYSYFTNKVWFENIK